MHSKRPEQFDPPSAADGDARPQVAPPMRADLLTGLLEGAHEMIAILDLSFHFLALSRTYQAEFAKVFGIELKEGDSLLDRMESLPEAKENALEIWERTLRGEAFTTTHTFGLPGRERRSYEIRSIPLRDGEGRLIAGAHAAADVTERMRNEEFSRRILENSQDCIKTLDLEGRLLTMNRGGMCQLEIDDLEPLLGQSWLGLWGEAERPLAAAAMTQARGGRSGRFQAYRPTMKGRPKWWDVTVSPIHDAAGRAELLLVISRDITEQKQAENDLRRSEERFRRLSETSSVGLAIADAQGVIRYANPAVLKMLGYAWEDVQDARCVNFIATDYIGQHDKMLHEALERGVTETYEKEVIAKDGRRVSVLSGAALIATEAEGGPLVAFFLTDLTLLKAAEAERERLLEEQKQALEALKQERTFFRQVIDLVPGFIFVKDLDVRFALANRAVAESYATTPEELVGKTDADFNPNREEVEHFINDDREVILERQGKFIPEEKVTDVHGGVHWVATNKLPLADEQGRYHQVLGVSSDISARKKAEEALRAANDQLREADRRKDEFLAMLAHELRNPLAPIRNSIHVLRLKGGEEGARLRHQEIIDRQVSHMARLLDDLLEVSRITRGKIELRSRPVALAEVLAQAAETAAPLIERRRQMLTIASPPPGLRVMADADRLAQVVGNLLTNASKYTDEGGQIWLEAVREGERAEIHVRDTGVGIAPEMLPRVFELFAQADRTLGHAQGGLGIGLTMVQRLVQMHGGTVEARSAGLGRGSEFIVRLPVLAEGNESSTETREAKLHANQL